MKKLISILMAAVMLFNIPVYAASYASLNKTKTIRDDEQPSDQYLKITPLDEVETGSSIIISFTNAKVCDQTQIDYMYQYPYEDWKGSSQGFWDVMPKLKTDELPYKIRKVGHREIQVYLCNLPRGFADGSLFRVNGINRRPVYRIRLPFISDGEGTIQIKIDNNSSTISSATLSGYYIWSSHSNKETPSNFIDTEGSDGEILEETTTETTTAAAKNTSSSEAETETTTELPNIFDLNYNDYIAVRDIESIIENSLYKEYEKITTEKTTEATTEETTEEAADETDETSVTAEAEEIEAAAAEAGEETLSEEPEAIAEEEPEEYEDFEEAYPYDDIDITVTWDAFTKTSTIYLGDTELQFISYSDYYVLNGEIIYFEGGLGSVIIDGKMYVPAGLIIDALGLEKPTASETSEEYPEVYEEPVEITTESYNYTDL